MTVSHSQSPKNFSSTLLRVFSLSLCNISDIRSTFVCPKTHWMVNGFVFRAFLVYWPLNTTLVTHTLSHVISSDIMLSKSYPKHSQYTPTYTPLTQPSGTSWSSVSCPKALRLDCRSQEALYHLSHRHPFIKDVLQIKPDRTKIYTHYKHFLNSFCESNTDEECLLEGCNANYLLVKGRAIISVTQEVVGCHWRCRENLFLWLQSSDLYSTVWGAFTCRPTSGVGCTFTTYPL